MKINGDLDVTGVFFNVKFKSLGTVPTFDPDDKGLLFFDNTKKLLVLNDGSNYMDIAFDSSKPIVVPLGGNWINSDFTFNPTSFNSFENVSGLNNSSTLFDVLVQIDQSIDNINKKTLTSLDDTDFSSLNDNDIIIVKEGKFFNVPIIDYLDENSITTIGGLEDVTIDAPADLQALLYNDGDSEFKNETVHVYYENFSGLGNTFNVTHNLNSEVCHVTVSAAQTDRQINDAIITFTDKDTVRIVAESFSEIEKELLGDLKAVGMGSSLDLSLYGPEYDATVANLVMWGFAIENGPELELTSDGFNVSLEPKIKALISKI